MVETSLDEIFSGDIPRIDTVSIFPGAASKVSEYALQFGGIFIDGDTCIVFNESQEQFQDRIEVEAVFLVRIPDGFRVEFGSLPEAFHGMFHLQERVTFKEKDLPSIDEVSKVVAQIKECQDQLDSGIIGMWRWVQVGKLWAGVRRLNRVLAEDSS